jgi:carbonic anhydrase/acetyltransferase-like protein (isoleucine patch superfamily)
MPIFSLGEARGTHPGEGKYWIAHNATVVGNVHIAEDVSIWFNAVIRSELEAIHIGARSNIQDGCVLHTDPGFPMTIGAGCTIGHMVMLHGCTIGAGSLVGIGSIILNGAVIGEDCLIGSNSLISEGKKIPPRSVVMGSPGKVVREVTDKDLERMRGATQSYTERWRHYVAKLAPQA